MENAEVNDTEVNDVEVDGEEQIDITSDEGGEEESFADYVKRTSAQDAQNNINVDKEVQAEIKKEEQTEEKVKEETQPQTVKYKVDGEEYEVDLKEASQLLSKAAGADRRFQEAANIRNEAKEFVQFIKTNPIAALQRAGIDFEQLAIDHVHELVTVQQMSPEQREAYEAKKERDQLKKEKEERERLSKEEQERQSQEEVEAETKRYIEEFETSIIDAMKSSSHLPKTRVVADRFIHYMRMALDRGYENVTAQDVLTYVEKDFSDHINKAKVNEYQTSKPKTESKPKPKSSKRISSVYDLFE